MDRLQSGFFVLPERIVGNRKKYAGSNTIRPGPNRLQDKELSSVLQIDTESSPGLFWSNRDFLGQIGTATAVL